jgi:pilus assembly protein CpaB
MTGRTILLALVALMIAGATAFFIRGYLNQERAEVAAVQTPPPPPPTQKVLVAAVPLPAGLLIKEEHLRWQTWPDETLEPSYIDQEGADITKYYGAVVRRGIAPGQPVTEPQIARPGDRGFLAAVLKPGMRAISVNINRTSGVAGLVQPGDRVDLLLSLALPTPDNAPEGAMSHRATETVFENVRVLALDQTISDQQGKPLVADVATVEVTPKQAEMLAVLTQIGSLTMTLRSLTAPDQEELDTGAEAMIAAVARGVETEDAGAAPADQPAGLPGSAKTERPGNAAPDAADEAVGADAEGEAAATPDPWADVQDPERGSTYTMDTEVSRLLEALSVPAEEDTTAKPKVIVNRGSSAEIIEFD